MQANIGSAERVTLQLRSLYDQYGYRHYKMSKFEEYDLYARNKDFLIGDNVITFTDLSGKLMALKPDVTLSIVKNSKDDAASVQKLYYNENVYRVAKGAQGFKEIMQVGLEVLGDIDDYCVFEVLTLAAKSLRQICENAILDVSHLGLLSELLESIGVPNDKKEQLLKFISEKNAHELTALCLEAGISQQDTDRLRQLVALRGTPKQVLPRLEELLSGCVSSQTLNQFKQILTELENSDCGALLRIDFSVVDNLRYYNGFVFKGFVEGLPGSVLSGGQYDQLMRRMKRVSRAMGFAVYTDLLDRLEPPADGYDVDTVLVYDDAASICAVHNAVQTLTAEGISVTALRSVPAGLRYRRMLKIINGEVQEQ